MHRVLNQDDVTEIVQCCFNIFLQKESGWQKACKDKAIVDKHVDSFISFCSKTTMNKDFWGSACDQANTFLQKQTQVDDLCHRGIAILKQPGGSKALVGFLQQWVGQNAQSSKTFARHFLELILTRGNVNARACEAHGVLLRVLNDIRPYPSTRSSWHDEKYPAGYVVDAREALRDYEGEMTEVLKQLESIRKTLETIVTGIESQPDIRKGAVSYAKDIILSIANLVFGLFCGLAAKDAFNAGMAALGINLRVLPQHGFLPEHTLEPQKNLIHHAGLSEMNASLQTHLTETGADIIDGLDIKDVSEAGKTALAKHIRTADRHELKGMGFGLPWEKAQDVCGKNMSTYQGLLCHINLRTLATPNTINGFTREYLASSLDKVSIEGITTPDGLRSAWKKAHENLVTRETFISPQVEAVARNIEYEPPFADILRRNDGKPFSKVWDVLVSAAKRARNWGRRTTIPLAFEAKDNETKAGQYVIRDEAIFSIPTGSQALREKVLHLVASFISSAGMKMVMTFLGTHMSSWLADWGIAASLQGALTGVTSFALVPYVSVIMTCLIAITTTYFFAAAVSKGTSFVKEAVFRLRNVLVGLFGEGTLVDMMMNMILTLLETIIRIMDLVTWLIETFVSRVLHWLPGKLISLISWMLGKFTQLLLSRTSQRAWKRSRNWLSNRMQSVTDRIWQLVSPDSFQKRMRERMEQYNKDHHIFPDDSFMVEADMQQIWKRLKNIEAGKENVILPQQYKEKRARDDADDLVQPGVSDGVTNTTTTNTAAAGNIDVDMSDAQTVPTETQAPGQTPGPSTPPITPPRSSTSAKQPAVEGNRKNTKRRRTKVTNPEGGT